MRNKTYKRDGGEGLPLNRIFQEALTVEIFSESVEIFSNGVN